jgi:hypothetical protein
MATATTRLIHVGTQATTLAAKPTFPKIPKDTLFQSSPAEAGYNGLRFFTDGRLCLTPSTLLTLAKWINPQDFSALTGNTLPLTKVVFKTHELTTHTLCFNPNEVFTRYLILHYDEPDPIVQTFLYYVARYSQITHYSIKTKTADNQKVNTDYPIETPLSITNSCAASVHLFIGHENLTNGFATSQAIYRLLQNRKTKVEYEIAPLSLKLKDVVPFSDAMVTLVMRYCVNFFSILDLNIPKAADLPPLIQEEADSSGSSCC